MKPVGAGKIYYFGTNLGASIAAGDAGGIEIIRTIVADTLHPRVSCAGKLRPRLMEGGGRSLLAVFNMTDQPQTGSIRLPAGYHHARDIYSGKEFAVSANSLELTVPFREVGVFDLE